MYFTNFKIKRSIKNLDYNNNESQKIIEEALRILDRPKITLVDVATQYEEVHDMADLNNNSTPKLVKILKISIL